MIRMTRKLGAALAATLAFLMAPALAPAQTLISSPNSLPLSIGSSTVLVGLAGVDKLDYGTTNAGAFTFSVPVYLASSQPLGWVDLPLNRDAANSLALRNGASPQGLNIYNTFTDAANYERAQIFWSGNVLNITTTAAGTGSNRNISLYSPGSLFLGGGGTSSGQWQISPAGQLIAVTDNNNDIGTSGANRPRNIYVGNNGTFGGNVTAVSLISSGYVASSTPVTISASTYSVAATDSSIICTNATSCTLTLPAAGSFAGRRLNLKTTGGGTVVSASANVVPLAGGAAGTAILAATAGKFALLVSDGTNWIIMEAN